MMDKNIRDGIECISIIVAAYQAEKCIIKCLSSILNQTYKNLQIIVVDDGSTDKTPEIIDDLACTDDRLVIVHKKNEGVSSARNTGIKYATGKFLMFIDADDSIENEMCEILFEEYQKQKCDLLISGIVQVRNGRKLVRKQENAVFDKKGLVDNFENHCNSFIYQSLLGKLYLTELVKKCQFKTGFRLGEDLCFNYHYFTYVNRIRIIAYSGYFYHINADSATHKFNENDFDMQFTLMEEGKKYYKNISGKKEVPKVIEQKYVGNVMGILVSLVTTMNITESCYYLKKYMNDEFFISKLKSYFPTKKSFKILKKMCLKKSIIGFLLFGKLNKMRRKIMLINMK